MSQSILFVDDDEEARYVLSRFLAEEGFVVHTASNGLEALNLLGRIAQPALILLDFMMPIMNGAELLGELRRESRYESIPVVFLSGHIDEWKGMTLGADHVLAKPVSPEELLTTIKRFSVRPARVLS